MASKTYIEDVVPPIDGLVELVNAFEGRTVLLDQFQKFEDEKYGVHHTNAFSGFKMMVAADFFYCLKRMGHNAKYNTLESISFEIYLHKLYGKGLAFDIFSKSSFLSDTKADMESSIFLKDKTDFDLIMPQYLEFTGFTSGTIAKRYYKLLHKICQAVAACDENVDVLETAYLALLELNALKYQKIEERYEKEKEAKEAAERNQNVQANEEFDECEIVDEPEEESESTDPISELVSLVGLNNVKEDVANLRNLLKIQKIRESRGLKTTPISYHCVFTGNPGTGKTTVARILADIYKELGILNSGHLVETDRSGLVADYVGQTATKTNAIIDKALDGVLFVDEAYSLVQGGQSDYGKEAISTLLKRMEDDRNRLIVILAGYSREMDDFINSNSGLKSRFSRFFNFQDYNSEELFEIFKNLLEKNQLNATPDALTYVRTIISEEVKNKDCNFGNARYIRNLFESIITQQANRLATVSNITDDDLNTIKIEDVIKIV